MTQLTSKIIKEEIKKSGVDTKKISVKKESGWLETAFYVIIKSPAINKKKIDEIVSKFEKYERDYMTGEILTNANTFIFVEYEHGIFDEVIKPHIEQAQKAIESLKSADWKRIYNINENLTLSISIEGKGYTVRQQDDYSKKCTIRNTKQLAECMYLQKQFNDITI